MNVKTLAASLTALGIAGLANAQDYNGGGFAIPDNNGAGGATSIVVADPGLVGNGMIVGITFGPEHTWVGDLSAVITHNDGSTSVSADLFRRVGQTSAGVGFGNSNDMNGTYRFSDSFATAFWNTPAVGGNVTAGDFRATTNLFNGAAGPVVNLNAIFAGRSLAGTWTLTVADHAAGDTGSVTGWTLTVPAPGALALLGVAGLAGSRRRRA